MYQRRPLFNLEKEAKLIKKQIAQAIQQQGKLVQQRNELDEEIGNLEAQVITISEKMEPTNTRVEAAEKKIEEIRLAIRIIEEKDPSNDLKIASRELDIAFWQRPLQLSRAEQKTKKQLSQLLSTLGELNTQRDSVDRNINLLTQDGIKLEGYLNKTTKAISDIKTSTSPAPGFYTIISKLLAVAGFGDQYRTEMKGWAEGIVGYYTGGVSNSYLETRLLVYQQSLSMAQNKLSRLLVSYGKKKVDQKMADQRVTDLEEELAKYRQNLKDNPSEVQLLTFLKDYWQDEAAYLNAEIKRIDKESGLKEDEIELYGLELSKQNYQKRLDAINGYLEKLPLINVTFLKEGYSGYLLTAIGVAKIEADIAKSAVESLSNSIEFTKGLIAHRQKIIKGIEEQQTLQVDQKKPTLPTRPNILLSIASVFNPEIKQAWEEYKAGREAEEVDGPDESTGPTEPVGLGSKLSGQAVSLLAPAFLGSVGAVATIMPGVVWGQMFNNIWQGIRTYAQVLGVDVESLVNNVVQSIRRVAPYLVPLGAQVQTPQFVPSSSGREMAGNLVYRYAVESGIKVAQINRPVTITSDTQAVIDLDGKQVVLEIGTTVEIEGYLVWLIEINDGEAKLAVTPLVADSETINYVSDILSRVRQFSNSENTQKISRELIQIFNLDSVQATGTIYANPTGDNVGWLKDVLGKVRNQEQDIRKQLSEWNLASKKTESLQQKLYALRSKINYKQVIIDPKLEAAENLLGQLTDIKSGLSRVEYYARGSAYNNETQENKQLAKESADVLNRVNGWIRNLENSPSYELDSVINQISYISVQSRGEISELVNRLKTVASEAKRAASNPTKPLARAEYDQLVKEINSLPDSSELGISESVSNDPSNQINSAISALETYSYTSANKLGQLSNEGESLATITQVVAELIQSLVMTEASAPVIKVEEIQEQPVVKEEVKEDEAKQPWQRSEEKVLPYMAEVKAYLKQQKRFNLAEYFRHVLSGETKKLGWRRVFLDQILDADGIEDWSVVKSETADDENFFGSTSTETMARYIEKMRDGKFNFRKTDEGTLPIELVHLGNGVYYAIDGRHRVAAAKASGIEFLVAKVVEPKDLNFETLVKGSSDPSMASGELASAMEFVSKLDEGKPLAQMNMALSPSELLESAKATWELFKGWGSKLGVGLKKVPGLGWLIEQYQKPNSELGQLGLFGVEGRSELDEQASQSIESPSDSPQSLIAKVVDRVTRFGRRDSIEKLINDLPSTTPVFDVVKQQYEKVIEDYEILPKDYLFPVSDPVALKNAGSNEQAVQEYLGLVNERYGFLDPSAEAYKKQHEFLSNTISNLATKLNSRGGKQLRTDTKVYISLEPMINAYVLPDGSVVITQKLLDGLDFSDEIAAVLAHELSHYQDTYLTWNKVGTPLDKRIAEYKADALSPSLINELGFNQMAVLYLSNKLESFVKGSSDWTHGRQLDRTTLLRLNLQENELAFINEFHPLEEYWSSPEGYFITLDYLTYLTQSSFEDFKAVWGELTKKTVASEDQYKFIVQKFIATQRNQPFDKTTYYVTWQKLMYISQHLLDEHAKYNDGFPIENVNDEVRFFALSLLSTEESYPTDSTSPYVGDYFGKLLMIQADAPNSQEWQEVYDFYTFDGTLLSLDGFGKRITEISEAIDNYREIENPAFDSYNSVRKYLVQLKQYYFSVFYSTLINSFNVDTDIEIYRLFLDEYISHDAYSENLTLDHSFVYYPKYQGSNRLDRTTLLNRSDVVPHQWDFMQALWWRVLQQERGLREDFDSYDKFVSRLSEVQRKKLEQLITFTAEWIRNTQNLQESVDFSDRDSSDTELNDEIRRRFHGMGFSNITWWLNSRERVLEVFSSTNPLSLGLQTELANRILQQAKLPVHERLMSLYDYMDQGDKSGFLQAYTKQFNVNHFLYKSSGSGLILPISSDGISRSSSDEEKTKEFALFYREAMEEFLASDEFISYQKTSLSEAFALENRIRKDVLYLESKVNKQSDDATAKEREQILKQLDGKYFKLWQQNPIREELAEIAWEVSYDAKEKRLEYTTVRKMRQFKYADVVGDETFSKASLSVFESLETQEKLLAKLSALSIQQLQKFTDQLHISFGLSNVKISQAKLSDRRIISPQADSSWLLNQEVLSNYYGKDSHEMLFLQPVIEAKLSVLQQYASTLSVLSWDELRQAYYFAWRYSPPGKEKRELLTNIRHRLIKEGDFSDVLVFVEEELGHGNFDSLYYFRQERVDTDEEYAQSSRLLDVYESDQSLDGKVKLAGFVTLDKVIGDLNIDQNNAMDFLEAVVKGDDDLLASMVMEALHRKRAALQQLGVKSTEITQIERLDDWMNRFYSMTKLERFMFFQRYFSKFNTVMLKPDNIETISKWMLSYISDIKPEEAQLLRNILVSFLSNVKGDEMILFLSNILSEYSLVGEPSHTHRNTVMQWLENNPSRLKYVPSFDRFLTEIREPTQSLISMENTRKSYRSSRRFYRDDIKEINAKIKANRGYKKYKKYVTRSYNEQEDFLSYVIADPSYIPDSEIESLYSEYNPGDAMIHPDLLVFRERESDYYRQNNAALGITPLSSKIKGIAIKLGRFITTAGQAIGALGVRFLQVFGQYYTIPDDFKEEFNDVYDNASSLVKYNLFQSMAAELDRMRTIRDESWINLDAYKEWSGRLNSERETISLPAYLQEFRKKSINLIGFRLNSTDQNFQDYDQRIFLSLFAKGLREEGLSEYSEANASVFEAVFVNTLESFQAFYTSQVEATEYLKANLKIEEVLGGGSINTAYLVSVTQPDGSIDKQVVKIISPNLESFLQERAEQMDNTVDNLIAIDPERGQEYGMAKGLMGTLRTWVRDDVNDGFFLFDDAIFSSEDFYPASGSMSTSRALMPYGYRIKVEEYVEGDTLKKVLSGSDQVTPTQTDRKGRVKDPVLKSALTDFVKDYLSHLLTPVADSYSGETIHLLHSDFHIGNLMLNKLPDGSYEKIVIDRNYYLKLLPVDIELITKLSTASTLNFMSKVDAMLDYFIEVNPNKEDHEQVRKEVRSVIVTKLFSWSSFSDMLKGKDLGSTVLNNIMSEFEKRGYKTPLRFRLFFKNVSAINNLLEYIDGSSLFEAINKYALNANIDLRRENVNKEALDLEKIDLERPSTTKPMPAILSLAGQGLSSAFIALLSDRWMVLMAYRNLWSEGAPFRVWVESSWGRVRGGVGLLIENRQLFVNQVNDKLRFKYRQVKDERREVATFIWAQIASTFETWIDLPSLFQEPRNFLLRSFARHNFNFFVLGLQHNWFDVDSWSSELRKGLADYLYYRNDLTVFFYLDELRLTGNEYDEYRLGLVKKAANNYPEVILRYSDRFDFSGEEYADYRYQLAEIVAKKTTGIFLWQLDEIGMKDFRIEQRYELAKIMAKKDPFRFLERLDEFDFTGKKELEMKYEVVKLALESEPNVYGTLLFLDSLGMQFRKFLDEDLLKLPSEQRLELFKILVNANASNEVKKFGLDGPEFRRERVGFLLTALKNNMFIDQYEINRYEAVPESLISQNINDLSPRERVRVAVEAIETSIPGLLPENISSALFAESIEVESMLSILIYLVENPDFALELNNTGGKVLLRRVAMRMLGVERATEFEKSKKISSTALRDFYAYTTNLHESVGRVIQVNETLNNDLLNSTKGIETLNGYLLSVFKLIGIRDQEPRRTMEVVSRLFEPSELTIEFVRDRKVVLEGFYVNRFKRGFGLKEIDSESIDKLTERWGDLTTLTILLARYKSNRKWLQELEPFSKVVEAVLEGRFEEYKYEGYWDSEADQQMVDDQLRGLSKKALRRWRSNPGSLIVPENLQLSKVKENEKSLIEQLKEAGFKQKHIHKDVGDLDVELSKDEMDQVNAKLREANGDILKVRINKASRKLLTKFIWLQIRDSSEAEFINRYLSFLSANNLVVDVDLKGDVKAFRDNYRRVQKSGAPKSALIFTTFVDNPKLLIEIGDVVATSSCQNYKTGGMIETLLGYVVDANVKALLSFNIEPNMLVNEDGSMITSVELNEIQQLVDEGSSKIRYEFDPASKTLLIKLKEDLSTKEYQVQFDKALRREIVKYGTTRLGRPALFKEPAYESYHQVMGVVRGEMDKVFQQMSNEMNAAVTGKINVSKSRNPGGVYSDVNRGVQHRDYQVNLNKEEAEVEGEDQIEYLGSGFSWPSMAQEWRKAEARAIEEGRDGAAKRWGWLASVAGRVKEWLKNLPMPFGMSVMMPEGSKIDTTVLPTDNTKASLKLEGLESYLVPLAGENEYVLVRVDGERVIYGGQELEDGQQVTFVDDGVADKFEVVDLEGNTSTLEVNYVDEVVVMKNQVKFQDESLTPKRVTDLFVRNHPPSQVAFIGSSMMEGFIVDQLNQEELTEEQIATSLESRITQVKAYLDSVQVNSERLDWEKIEREVDIEMIKRRIMDEARALGVTEEQLSIFETKNVIINAEVFRQQVVRKAMDYINTYNDGHTLEDVVIALMANTIGYELGHSLNAITDLPQNYIPYKWVENGEVNEIKEERVAEFWARVGLGEEGSMLEIVHKQRIQQVSVVNAVWQAIKEHNSKTESKIDLHKIFNLLSEEINRDQNNIEVKNLLLARISFYGELTPEHYASPYQRSDIEEAYRMMGLDEAVRKQPVKRIILQLANTIFVNSFMNNWRKFRYSIEAIGLKPKIKMIKTPQKDGFIDKGEFISWLRSHDTKKTKKVAEILGKNIRYVSFNEFLVKLNKIAKIFKDKVGGSDYLMMTTSEGDHKSGWWVSIMTRLLMEGRLGKLDDYMTTSWGVGGWLKSHEGVNDVVIIDDASYSGGQLVSYLVTIFSSIKGSELNMLDRPINISLAVPFMSTFAEKNIYDLLFDIFGIVETVEGEGNEKVYMTEKGVTVTILPHEKILSVREMFEAEASSLSSLEIIELLGVFEKMYQHDKISLDPDNRDILTLFYLQSKNPDDASFIPSIENGIVRNESGKMVATHRFIPKIFEPYKLQRSEEDNSDVTRERFVFLDYSQIPSDEVESYKREEYQNIQPDEDEGPTTDKHMTFGDYEIHLDEFSGLIQSYLKGVSDKDFRQQVNELFGLFETLEEWQEFRSLIKSNDQIDAALKIVDEEAEKHFSVTEEEQDLGQCVTGDTLLAIAKTKGSEPSFTSLQTAGGSEPIREIRIDEVKGGEEVWSLNQETGELEARKIKGLMDMGVKQVYELVTEDGRKIKTTANHPYLVRTTKKSAEADLVHLTDLSTSWIDTLRINISQKSGLSNYRGVDPSGVEPDKLGVSTQLGKPAGPIPITNISYGGEWTKVSELKSGMEIAVAGELFFGADVKIGQKQDSDYQQHQHGTSFVQDFVNIHSINHSGFNSFSLFAENNASIPASKLTVKNEMSVKDLIGNNEGNIITAPIQPDDKLISQSDRVSDQIFDNFINSSINFDANSVKFVKIASIEYVGYNQVYDI
ncbi:MAG: M48 family metalloprotease [Candidatus Pacebacteria bacterium]|nr:M48 family metalloprotease [Candidatus Paceibacterota bacterium]